MKSQILSATVRELLPLLLAFSIFMLLRGHNEPGGGFIGGLVAASGLALYILALGVAATRELIRIDPRTLIGIGLVIAVLGGLASVAGEMPFMTGLWLDAVFPLIGKVGTPFLFDVGVYVLVIGASLTIIFAVAEE